MPTVFTHVIAATALGIAIQPPKGMPGRWWTAAAVCSVLPDADVLAFSLGIPYAHLLGHRGLSHSLVFAGILAGIMLFALRDRSIRGLGNSRTWLFLFVTTCSHGLLDAMTSGGLGVAFFAPFSPERYFLPWRPIRVAPIGIAAFFSERGLAVLKSEAMWVWLPSATLILIAFFFRKPESR